MTDAAPLTPEILVPRLGAVLVEKKLITPDQLQAAVDRQDHLRDQKIFPSIGQVLVELGFIDRPHLDEAVTEQIIALKAALQDANQNLERRVEQRTTELQQALKRLSELSELKTNFISNISHELRTPLTHIRGYIDLIAAQELGPLTPDQEMAIEVMQRSTDRLERLIEDLLLFTTVEQGQMSVIVRSFDLCRLCQSVIKRHQMKAEEKRISLVFETSEASCLISGDEEKIGVVLIQLIDNAIKFSNPGQRVILRLLREQDETSLQVVDSGIGIEQERIPELFTPFHQLDGSSTRRYGGTGLGLALAKKIIDAHGFTFNVTSQPGIGSVFEVRLKYKSGT